MKRLNITEETKKDLLSSLLKRSPANYAMYSETVEKIIANVRENGDKALFDYTKEFDKADINSGNIRVTKEEMDAAVSSVDSGLIGVLERAAENIRYYHSLQKRNSWFDTKDGIMLGQKITPIEKAGVYVPGGKAAYPSSLLMNVIPAQVAGVKRIIISTPCDAEGKVYEPTLAAARVLGIDEIYKCGGAQAIAAMAFGTGSVPKVDKITGPGNIYVALAKKAVFGFVSIDSIAGPSEILVLADDTADPGYVAADLLSQAEHDEMASSILITTSAELADQVEKKIEGFLKELSRADIIKKSLDNYGYILIAKDENDMVECADEIASEHMEIMTRDPYDLMTRVKNAGAIFLGSYSSEPLGDYYAGPNHILPTNGTARFFSPLSVDDFIKKSSVIAYSRDALKAAHEDIEKFARHEGLTAHANSIAVRFESEEDR